MRELRAAKPEAPGSGRQMSMLLFFEPSSGLFSWDASETEEADEGAPKRLRAFKDGGFVVLRQGHLITFVLEQSPPRLRITDRQTHAADLDQAQEMALYTADGFRGPGGELTIDDRAQHIVSLAHMTTFLNDPTGGTQAPRITDADRDDQRWKLTISGPWKERIVLDALYNLVTIYKLK
jgi:hypothetical protein